MTNISFKNLINKNWLSLLESELKQEYIEKLEKFISLEVNSGKIIFPKIENLFKALNDTNPQNIKVVILGQDPYHGEGQAHGLSFSVPTGMTYPPSLKNIFKELESDLNCPSPQNGDLSAWAQQGVLLLNSVLSVEQSKAASHQGKGWEKLTDKIIEIVDRENSHTVFILWGSYAQKKAAFVDRKKHLVLESVHPSPLSSYRGFFGSKPFSKANTWLAQNKIETIKWC